ncbi:MAG TPA: hypothetical protein VFA18_01235, partial [Gemmataceae bacterium]|nr:hypothetical protein [Gemmataceae bacterium]
MKPVLTFLLDAAVRAPSGDNTQPWRFQVDEDASCISFLLDEARDPSPMNAGQRMARIAVGAALENVIHTATAKGWQVELAAPSPPALAAVRVVCANQVTSEVDPTVAARLTNRRPYDCQPVPPAVLQRLMAKTPPMDGVDTHWIVDRQRLAVLACLIGRADGLMFGERHMRHAFLRNIRFDAPPAAEVEEGLSLASLELPSKSIFALRMLRWLPGWVLRSFGGLRAFASNAQRLVDSASGLCMITAPDDRCSTDLTVGRAMARAWLSLTTEGMSAQPMMSLVVLD